MLPPRGPGLPVELARRRCCGSSTAERQREASPAAPSRPPTAAATIETARAPRPSITSTAREQRHRAPFDDDVGRGDGRPRARATRDRESASCRRASPTGLRRTAVRRVCSMTRAMTNGRPASDSTNATLPASASTTSTLAASDTCRTRTRRRFGGGGAVGRASKRSSSKREAHGEVDAHLLRLLAVRDVEAERADRRAQARRRRRSRTRA